MSFFAPDAVIIRARWDAVKYLCSRCERLVHPARIEVHDASIELVCPKCGAREEAEATGDAPPATAAPILAPPSSGAPDASACPKCGAPRADLAACPRCGLVFERWRQRDADAPAPALVALWERVVEKWDDTARHDEFVTAAFESSSLAYAARCYRGRGDEVAGKQLEKLTLLGVQAMRGAEAPYALTPKVGRIIGWVVFVVLCLVLASLALIVARTS